MANEPNIAELAVAAWRLERWLDNLVAERKMAAKSSLRSIKKFLEASNIEVVDPVGTKFDPGLAIEVINNEAPDIDESELIIIETNAPIVKQDGAVIQYGRVILGTSVKEQKSNSEIVTDNSEETQEYTPEKPEEKTSKERSSIIITSQYYAQKFELYSELEGCVAGIEVKMGQHALADSLSVYLMDKYNFKDFQQGFNPSLADGYHQEKEIDYLRIPYQGDWYVVICNQSWVWKDDYEINMRMGWFQVKSRNELTGSDAVKDDNQPEAVKTASDQEMNGQDTPYDKEGTDVPSETKATDATQQNTDEIKVSPASEPVTVEEHSRAERSKTDINISEKAAKSLAKKNAASYMQEVARMHGLLGKPHGKKG